MVWENVENLCPKKWMNTTQYRKKSTARLGHTICVHSHLFAFSSARKSFNILNQRLSRVYISFFQRWHRYHLFIFIFLIHFVVSTSAERVAWPLVLYNLSSTVDAQKCTQYSRLLTLTAPPSQLKFPVIQFLFLLQTQYKCTSARKIWNQINWHLAYSFSMRTEANHTMPQIACCKNQS